jgi:YbgC/YbaW family acyl-CoA thioester hydrolase
VRNTVDLPLPNRDSPAGSSYQLVPRLSDIDFGGVVHHTVLLRYFEEGRLYYLQDRGFAFDQFAALGTIPIVSRMAVEYRSAVVHDHAVTLEISVTQHRTRTIEFTCRMWQRDQLCVRAAAELMVTDLEGKSARVPRSLVDALSR